MRRSIVPYFVTFAGAGAVVAMALLAYDYLVLIFPSGYNTATDFGARLMFGLCPPSIALMALENAHGAKLGAGLRFMVLMNARLYGVVGSLLYSLAFMAKRLAGKRS